MKFRFGNSSREQIKSPIEEGWHRIHSPSPRLGYVLAGVTGLVVVFVLFGWLVAVSLYSSQSEVGREVVGDTVPWGAVLLAMLLFIPVHELIHAIWLPHFGLSPQTVMVIWPRKLRIGVYYEGCMARGRWSMMRLAPFVWITAITIGLLTLFSFVPAPYALVVFLQVFFLVNGLGSGGDLVAVLWVHFRVPTNTQICFRGGKAYWRVLTLSGEASLPANRHP